MYEGIDREKLYPYILRGERVLAEEMQIKEEAHETVTPQDRPTVWWIKPQTVATGNKHITRQGRAFTKKNDGAIADAMTKHDRNEFIDAVREIDNFRFKGEAMPREKITSVEDRSKAFDELDPETEKELVGASRDPFMLRESEKNVSSSSSGAGSNESTPPGSAMTASDVERMDTIEEPIA